jgi:exosortase J
MSSNSSNLSVSEGIIGDILEYSQPGMPPAIFWCGLVFLMALGTLGISRVLISLWSIWTLDPLQSIGMLIPIASIVLVLRVWRQNGWELRGTSWGLLPLVLAYLLSPLRQDIILFWSIGRVSFTLLPYALPLYLYGNGFVLLFAGTRVWRLAWFPLALLVLAKPVPAFFAPLFDLPLQRLSAHIALSFAALIRFPPANPQMLKLMFTPDFGMFIAPGCDGMRGAVTMGYLALIVGYLKRVSVLRWVLYITGAVFLGYLFNLLRLCALVLYYRVAVGHPALENLAKQADYAIGGCLFVMATGLYIWIVLRKDSKDSSDSDLSMKRAQTSIEKQRLVSKDIYWKFAAFAVLVLPVSGICLVRGHQGTLIPTVRAGGLMPDQLDELMPKQLGDYKLQRAWQEQLHNSTAMESAAYATAATNEIILGVWLPPNSHNIIDSWAIQGKDPKMRVSTDFVTNHGRHVDFDTAFYSDGITDSLVGNAFCARSSCFQLRNEKGVHVGYADTQPDGRTVPILFRIEMPHSDAPEEIVYKQLLAEAQSFLAGVDMTQLSQKFQ